MIKKIRRHLSQALNKVFISNNIDFIRKVDRNSDDINLLLDFMSASDNKILKYRDQLLIQKYYLNSFKKHIDLENPVTFNEKINWIKLNIRTEIMARYADKYQARIILSDAGYGKHLNHLFGVYHSTKELIDSWSELPDSFVIKTNHWSGDCNIVDSKSQFDSSNFSTIENILEDNYYYKMGWGEWIYKDMDPCIIIEKKLDPDEGSDILDYKFHCFNGKVKFIQIDIDRRKDHKRVIYDKDWKKKEFGIQFLPCDIDIPKPEYLDKMISFCETMSRDFPFIRIDLYNDEHQDFIFGEFTFFPYGGFQKFIPKEMDNHLGKILDISKYRISAGMAP